MSKFRELNFRDLGGIPLPRERDCNAQRCSPLTGEGYVPSGLFLRSGKLNVLSKEQCARLCRKYKIRCVIDLRTPAESAEFPDELPEGVEYLQIPLLKEAAVGITHETGTDPMTIVRNLRRHPEKLLEMIPDFKALYTDIVTDEYSRSQIDKAVSTLRQNAERGICTLFHCTAGKDRTGIVSMALLKSYGVSDEEIVKDYMRTNRNAFWPTIKKCVGVWLLTRNWSLLRTAYKSFMADRELIELALSNFEV